MGGFNPRKAADVEASIRDLEKLAKRFKKDQIEIDKTIKTFRALLRDLRKTKK